MVNLIPRSSLPVARSPFYKQPNQKDLGSKPNLLTKLLVILGQVVVKQWSKVSHKVVNSLVNRFAWGNQQKVETACCLIMFVIFMGLGGAYRLEGDFQIIIWGASHKRSKKTPSKDFHLAIGGRLGWMKQLKNGAEKGFIFHAIIPALYPFE